MGWGKGDCGGSLSKQEEGGRSSILEKSGRLRGQSGKKLRQTEEAAPSVHLYQYMHRKAPQEKGSQFKASIPREWLRKKSKTNEEEGQGQGV